MKFYSVSESAKKMLGPSCPDWYDQLGSFNRSNIEGHLQGMLTPFIEEIDVLVASLEEVLLMSGFDKLDILHIDAEGFDLEVLSSISIDLWRPTVIIFEHKHLALQKKEEFLKYLSNTGYNVRVFFDDVVAYFS